MYFFAKYPLNKMIGRFNGNKGMAFCGQYNSSGISVGALTENWSTLKNKLSQYFWVHN
jgi:hypothetical protein